MATARVPFAVLDSPRLSHLTSVKNRQNGTISTPHANGKSPLSNMIKATPPSSASKRQLSPSIYEDFDSENIDPAAFQSPSKRSKCNDGSISKPTFSLQTVKSLDFTKPSQPSTVSAPAMSTTPRNKANTSSPRAPLTAPAGRSPKSKRAGLANKPRRISAPYTRIDPPSFLGNSHSSTVPFSLDAALAGTLSASSAKPAKVTTIEDSMPRNWFFDIHEDTPEEEAANLMEHSTLCLDISSDEEGKKAAVEDKGKENTPPVDYEAPVSQSTRSSSQTGSAQRKKQQPRRKVLKRDEMDDGERSPLSDLETESFFPEGVKEGDVFIVQPEKPSVTPSSSSAATPNEKRQVFVAPEKMIRSDAKRSTPLDVPVVTKSGDVAGDIIIFEDSSSSDVDSSLTSIGAQLDESKENSVQGGKRKRVPSEMS